VTGAGLTPASRSTEFRTSRGADVWDPPMRVFAPSETTLLTLKAA
jgi:uncharacterized protein